MNKINYQKLLDEKIKENERDGIRPTLLLHACCAPCSSYTMEYLSKYFNISIYFYNPNIDTEEEFRLRIAELNRLIAEMPLSSEVKLLTGEYEPEKFYEIAKGRENIPEGGERCHMCYALRLEEAARAAVEFQMDYFTTTLSISPYKNAEWLNSLGEKYAKEYGVPYLYSDFKKKGGYARSVELSKEYGLYRQDYCGCVFSKAEMIKRKKEEEKRRVAEAAEREKE